MEIFELRKFTRRNNHERF